MQLRSKKFTDSKFNKQNKVVEPTNSQNRGLQIITVRNNIIIREEDDFYEPQNNYEKTVNYNANQHNKDYKEHNDVHLLGSNPGNKFKSLPSTADFDSLKIAEEDPRAEVGSKVRSRSLDCFTWKHPPVSQPSRKLNRRSSLNSLPLSISENHQVSRKMESINTKLRLRSNNSKKSLDKRSLAFQKKSRKDSQCPLIKAGYISFPGSSDKISDPREVGIAQSRELKLALNNDLLSNLALMADMTPKYDEMTQNGYVEQDSRRGTFGMACKRQGLDLKKGRANEVDYQTMKDSGLELKDTPKFNPNYLHVPGVRSFKGIESSKKLKNSNNDLVVRKPVPANPPTFKNSDRSRKSDSPKKRGSPVPNRPSNYAQMNRSKDSKTSIKHSLNKNIANKNKNSGRNGQINIRRGSILTRFSQQNPSLVVMVSCVGDDDQWARTHQVYPAEGQGNDPPRLVLDQRNGHDSNSPSHFRTASGEDRAFAARVRERESSHQDTKHTSRMSKDLNGAGLLAIPETRPISSRRGKKMKTQIETMDKTLHHEVEEEEEENLLISINQPNKAGAARTTKSKPKALQRQGTNLEYLDSLLKWSNATSKQSRKMRRRGSGVGYQGGNRPVFEYQKQHRTRDTPFSKRQDVNLFKIRNEELRAKRMGRKPKKGNSQARVAREGSLDGSQAPERPQKFFMKAYTNGTNSSLEYRILKPRIFKSVPSTFRAPSKSVVQHLKDVNLKHEFCHV